MTIMPPRTHAAAADECVQTQTLEQHEREIARLNKTVLFGDGAPSLVTQTAINTRVLGALVWVASITLAAVIGQIVIIFFRLAGKI